MLIKYIVHTHMAWTVFLISQSIIRQAVVHMGYNIIEKFMKDPNI